MRVTMSKAISTDGDGGMRGGFWNGLLGRKRVGTDQVEDTTTSPSFPWTYPEWGRRPIGSLFELTIDENVLADMYRRYQIGRRIVDAPVEESFYTGFDIVKKNGTEADPELRDAALQLWSKYQSKWLRFFKLVRLYGRCEMIFGWNDDPSLWADKEPGAGSTFTWLQPVPLQYEQELKVSESIPKKIEYLVANFGSDNIILHPSRFIHAMNPKLIDEDKEGESVLLPVANLLQVQIHADWSIGQALWRRAGGLLGMFAPKRRVTDEEKGDALQSVANHNAKTVLYIPFGWNVKELLRTSGNIAIARTYRVILEQISAGCGIPLSVLIGQQKSSLSQSNDDLTNYYRMIGSMQQNTMTPVIQKFFRCGQWAGLIPPGEIVIKWNPLEAQTVVERERELTEIGALRVLQARLEHENDLPGTVPTQDLVKLLSKRGR